jgi:hypothetical protein
VPAVGRHCGWRDQAELADAQGCQRFGCRTSDAGVADVADNDDGEIGKIRFVPADREGVEQALRGVRDVGFACVQDAHVILDVSRNIGRHVRARIAHDHDVHRHGLQRVDRVEDRLAFLARRGVDVQVEHIGTQPAARQVEGRPRARARLEKQVADRAALQRAAANRQSRPAPSG